MVFWIKYRHYEYIIMLFKLINVLAIIQNLVNDILKKYLDRFCIVYLDDILIFLDNEKEYEEHIIIVLKMLKKVGLRIKFEKCIFYINEVEYFGFIIISQGLRMDSAKI